jgi:hypothetical protein
MQQDVKKTANDEEKAIDDEDFFHRWSRRKHETQALLSPDTAELPESDMNAAILPTDTDMPPLDTLTDDSDYSGFLSPRVSEALRQQALRKLFRSPGFNIRDGLDDYDDDFTTFAELGDIVTSDMKHQLEKEAQRIQQRVEEELAASQEDDVRISPISHDATSTVSESTDLNKTDDDEVKSS